MSVLHALYNTYTNHEERAGEVITKPKRDGTMRTYMLLPFAHTTQTAHIEIYVTEQGDYHSAHVLQKESTVLPFTEDSGSRAGKVFCPHALHDKLMYVAGDYAAFTNEADKAEAFLKYKEQLANWAQSLYTHPDVQAIYAYISKGTVIRDLVKEGVLHTDEQGLLLKKWTGKEEKPDIFQVVASGQEAAFVRFRVRKIGGVPPWENKELFAKYTQYYMSTIHNVDLCYITGKESVRTMKHPNKIRNSGDKGKLISANDDSGFTYRGRFKSTKSSVENASISYEASQKIHNALKWLIEQQGIPIDGRVYVVWSEQRVDVPHFLELPDVDLSDMWPLSASEEIVTPQVASVKQHTNKQLAKNVAKLLQGMQANITEQSLVNEQVHILSLDAATTGRLSILSYRNFQTAQYFERLAMYQVRASWLQTVWVDKKPRTYMQAPTLRTIAQIAYGPRANDKLVKQTVERLIPLILEQRPMPFDIVQKMLARASNPHSFDTTTQFDQAVEVACSVMKYYFDKEEYTVALQEQNNNRSYLFGRLLAVAEVIERNAQLEDKRTTNAMRYMNAFQMNPQRTWMTIYHSLTPYRQKLGGSGIYYDRVLQDIIAQFESEDYMSNKALDGQYLLGYYSQLKAFYTKKDKDGGNE
ncbi:MAG: type I-C CRISPR-associated protein Cas8c/Csd1 [Caryophanon sp.]|nr:type I-C CRISPR-associated protein Cas8c/Csd1 [Caryophanon sp.]